MCGQSGVRDSRLVQDRVEECVGLHGWPPGDSVRTE
jgi:hypothetical protein